MYSIVEFRNNIKKAFDQALNNEVVIIIRGGVSYSLKAELTTYQPRGGYPSKLVIDTAYDETKFNGINETISKITSGIVKKANKKQEDFALLGIRTTTESKIDLENGKATITVKPNEEDVKAFKEKTYDFCKHDALKGFCKSGCK